MSGYIQYTHHLNASQFEILIKFRLLDSTRSFLNTNYFWEYPCHSWATTWCTYRSAQVVKSGPFGTQSAMEDNASHGVVMSVSKRDFCVEVASLAAAHIYMGSFKTLAQAIWAFPEMGVPVNHPFNGIFYYKPSGYWGIPTSGNLILTKVLLAQYSERNRLNQTSPRSSPPC